MRSKIRGLTVAVALLGAAAGTANAAKIESGASVLGGGAITFEGFAEGTLISNQFGGITFSQVDGGRPMIDNQPFLFGYNASSGTAVLTGSREGGAPFPTVAGITMTLAAPATALEFWLGDTSPLGVYTIRAYDGANILLESWQVNAGNYVGFIGLTGLAKVIVDSSVENDAFAIDDVRFNRVAVEAPEPGTLALLGLGLAGLALQRRRRA